MKHVLSRELQLYFERVTSAATDQDEAMREAALASLRGDPGLHQLVPYLVQWVAESVSRAFVRLGFGVLSESLNVDEPDRKRLRSL